MNDSRTETRLEARELSLGYAEKNIISGLSLPILNGGITALIGPNGSGKSTLLRGLARILPPSAGEVYLDGKSISQYPTREVAQKMGVLPQLLEAPHGITVRELVAFGRYPHQGAFRTLSSKDNELILWAMKTADVVELGDRIVETLSGGQRQCAWIAMALAQQTPILLLDEPTTFLDISHQIRVFQLLQRLNEEEKKTIVVVLHDINSAARLADYLVVMREGKISIQGISRDVLCEEVIQKSFNVSGSFVRIQESDVPFFIPKW